MHSTENVNFLIIYHVFLYVNLKILIKGVRFFARVEQIALIFFKIKIALCSFKFKKRNLRL